VNDNELLAARTRARRLALLLAGAYMSGAGLLLSAVRAVVAPRGGGAWLTCARETRAASELRRAAVKRGGPSNMGA
jgi:hypothetical protein